MYEIEPEELGADEEEVMIGSPLEPEDVTLEITLTLKGVLVSEEEGLELEIVLGKVELLVVIVEMEMGVLMVEIKEIDEVLLSTANEDVDVVGEVDVEFSPELGEDTDEVIVTVVVVTSISVVTTSVY